MLQTCLGACYDHFIAIDLNLDHRKRIRVRVEIIVHCKSISCMEESVCVCIGVCLYVCICGNGKLENGSILLVPQMKHISASLDSVASAADGIQKEA